MTIRPVVQVYQDFATQTPAPTTPDLNCLLVGPAYWIQDYFKPGTTDYADKTSMAVTSAYGALEGSPSAVTPTGPSYLTITEPPNNAVGAVLDRTSVKLFFDNARVIIQQQADGVTSASTPNTVTSAAGAWLTGNTKVQAGDRLGISDGTNYIWRTVAAVASDTSLTLTADVTGGAFVPGATQTYRIERRVNDANVDASFVTVTGNATSLAGGVTLPIVAQGNRIVSYAQVYEQYRSLRQDITELDTVESLAEITSKLGRIDARNPLAVGVFVAYQNTTTAVQFIGVATDDLTGHASVRDRISARPDVYAIVLLTTDVNIFAMWDSDCRGLSLPDDVRGRPQRFREVLGCGVLPVNKQLIAPSAVGEALPLTGSAPLAITKITLPTIATLVTTGGGVIPGDILRVTASTALGVIALADYPIAAVTSATVLEVNATTPFASAGTSTITAQVFRADGVTSRIGSTAGIVAVTTAGDDLYLILKDPAGTFVASGVTAGDLVQMPADPNTTITAATVFTTYVVESVLSDQRLRLVNLGADTSATANELPHGVKRVGGALVSATTINYKIVRTLSKSQQVTELIAVAQSFRSRRMLLVWSDKCDVAGVTGGTQQPGYYLAAAVGGMTAGLPPQQGFTNLGIAGISQIYNSNTYFSDAQLTDLSNGGWYVFAQQTPNSLPYTIHQLTTDTSTLESGEFSVVKNYDFVSLFFVDILEDFLGSYNVTPGTLVLLQSALNTGGELLKLRTVAKIGAPLTSFAVTQLGTSPVSGDRILAYIAIGLPKPLNVIELHLVA